VTDGAAALSAAEVAASVGGELRGEAARLVTGVAPLDRAGASDLSLLAGARYAPAFAATRAGVVLVGPDLADAPGPADVVRVVVARPHDALVALLPRFQPPPTRREGIHPTAVAAPTARIGRGVSVEAFAVIGDGADLADGVWVGPHCVVGDGVVVGPETRLVSQVTCYPGTVLGARVTVHAGTRLGSDGFGYAVADGAHRKIPHVGRCVIEDDVEIGANCAIDRGSIDDTVIGAGSKLDNLVHVAHNVRIGRHCLLMAQVGVAGSSRVGDGAILAGQVGVAGHLTIGAGARLAAQAGVISDVPAGETWSGYPARPHKDALRASAALFKLAAARRGDRAR
jgi:UDP-3-O-[3-hydroxymyristoyl] glucosamine N-acyltransferase